MSKEISKRQFLKFTAFPSWDAFPINFFFLLLCTTITIFFIFFLFQNYTKPNLPVFTTEELAKFDGKDGRPAYFAYEGKVYDVTKSKFWKNGKHPGGHLASQDLTDSLLPAPHGAEVLKRFPVVGILKR
jgi:predicted heme/steroid binding protein